MTISTKILKDLLNDHSVNKAVYYSPNRKAFLKTSEDVIISEGDAIKTPGVDDYKTLISKLFRKRIGARSIPLGDQLTLGYHLAKG